MRIFITGCSTGIGRALAIEFASQGHEVLATARDLESIKDLETSHNCRIACVDVTAPATLSAALNYFGHPVDICVANAGASAFGPLLDQNVALVESIMRTNVLGVLATVQSVAPSMMDRRDGLLVVIGSVSGRMTTPFAGAYCASKAAVTSMCEAMRMELSPFDVGVMEVVTGAVQSALSQNSTRDGRSRLPDGSRYSKLQPFVDARANLSQTSNALDARHYAKEVAEAALSQHPPARLVAGGNALFLDLLGRYAPLWFSSLVWQTRLGLDLLRKSDATPSFVGAAVTRLFGQNPIFFELCTVLLALLTALLELARGVARAGGKMVGIGN
jgi:short-subunit dehydrogenase